MTVPSDIDVVVARLRAGGCVFAEDEAALLAAEAATPTELEAMVVRRVSGEPLEQVVGWAEFAGLRVALRPGVFVPRMRTELLVREAIALTHAHVRRAADPTVVVDLCCGSGALGMAVAAAVPDIELHAADIEPAAVACARENLSGWNGLMHEGDLFAALPVDLRGRIDVLLANTPYVPTSEIELLPAEARDHEPRITLDGGSDGLDVQRRIAADAYAWLAPGGSLLVEVADHQVAAAVAVFDAAGLITRVAHDAELEATTVVARRVR